MGVDRDQVRQEFCPKVAQIWGVDNISRIGVEDIGFHLLRPFQADGSASLHREPRDLKVPFVVTHCDQITANPHHGFVLTPQGEDRILYRFVWKGALTRVIFNDIAK